MADLTFDIAPKRREPFTFAIPGDEYEYTFTPPKNAILMLPLMNGGGDDGDTGVMKGAVDWIKAGLHADGEWKRIEDRLRNPDDEFDTDPGLTTLVRKLNEFISARPTT